MRPLRVSQAQHVEKKKEKKRLNKQTNKNPGGQAFPLEFVDKVKETNSLKICEYAMPKVSPLPRIYKPLNLVSFSSTHISEVNQGSLGQVVDSGFFASQN